MLSPKKKIVVSTECEIFFLDYRLFKERLSSFVIISATVWEISIINMAGNIDKQINRFCDENRERIFRLSLSRIMSLLRKACIFIQSLFSNSILQIGECYAVANASIKRHVYHLLLCMELNPCKINRPTRNWRKVTLNFWDDSITDLQVQIRSSFSFRDWMSIKAAYELSEVDRRLNISKICQCSLFHTWRDWFCFRTS